MLGLAGHQADLLADLRSVAVDDADVGDDAPVVVVLRVEDQGPQRRVGSPGGGGIRSMMARKTLGRRPGPVLALTARTSLGSMPRIVLDLLADLVGPGGLHVDLVQDRDDRQVAVDRRVGVGDGLRLDPLRGVDQQDRPLAGGQAPRDLVVEVDVAGRVDQVQLVLLARRACS